MKWAERGQSIHFLVTCEDGYSACIYNTSMEPRCQRFCMDGVAGISESFWYPWRMGMVDFNGDHRASDRFPCSLDHRSPHLEAHDAAFDFVDKGCFLWGRHFVANRQRLHCHFQIPGLATVAGSKCLVGDRWWKQNFRDRWHPDAIWMAGNGGNDCCVRDGGCCDCSGTAWIDWTWPSIRL